MTTQDAFSALADQLADEIAQRVRERLAVTSPNERAAFSVEEVAEKLGLGVRSVRRLLDQGVAAARLGWNAGTDPGVGTR